MLNNNNKIDLNLLKEIIKFFEFGDASVELCLYLYDSNEKSITNISKYFKLNRTQTYKTLDELASKGLIKKELGFTKDFQLLELAQLRLLLEKNQFEQNLKLEKLNSLFDIIDKTTKDSSVEHLEYHSKPELQELFIELYKHETQEIDFIGDASNFALYMSEEFIEYAIKIRESKKVKHKILSCTKVPRNKFLDQKLDRQVKYLNVTFPGFIHILSDSIVFWNLGEDKVLWIKDPVYKDLIYILFDYIWSSII